ncbi:MAG: 16S rRNA (uracil(1498)-N(3))-methyltransferase [Saprospirales bacterium]|nr:16S rRNA (uracil(1498)-N(3))-methyltransferase [Saprospirales bacterium]MBK8921665.1 16S rRNA (uracil(1498)-N(3))-methyltransferase [Saprospirales bacterium]
MNQLFYSPHIENGLARLDEEETRHLIAVLRRQVGDHLELTDGKGYFYTAELVEAGKKHSLARILETRGAPEPAARLHLAVAPTKQIDRFEWLLEKATEIGIQEITPLLCRRSERTTVRHDRLEKILVSAMKQSLQSRLPRLNPLAPFAQVVDEAAEPKRFIAWCPDEPLPPLRTFLQPTTDTLMLIGPEGDFTPEEALYAAGHGFVAVNLGPTRLRTETAGLVAAIVLHYGVEE